MGRPETIAAPVATYPDLATLLARVPALAAELAEGAAERELARELPFAGFARFRASGLAALRLPAALGGPGGRPSDVIAIIADLAAAEPNLAHALRSHFNFTEGLALDPEQPKAALHAGRILRGALYAGAHTELGTPKPGEVTTRLRRDGDGFRLDGRKFYATGTAFADYGSFSAIDDDGAFVSALLPVDRKGITVLDDWDGMGQRMTASGGVLFEGVRVEPGEVETRTMSNQIGRHQSTLRQLHLCACSVGIVRNLLAEATAYVRGPARAAAHSAVATAAADPFIQKAIGEIAARSYALDALIAEAARALDRTAAALAGDGEDAESALIASSLTTARTQLVAGQLALEAAQGMFEAGGASATARRYNFDRHWRNIRTILNHNPLAQKARVVGDYVLNGTTDYLKEGRVF